MKAPLRGRQRGRLLELPILGVGLMLAGLWLGSYHPAGYLLTALPIVLWLGLVLTGLGWRVATRLRLGRLLRERLATLQAEGFSAGLVCKGDLARGDAWAAFDPAANAVKMLSEKGVRSFELSRLGSVSIEEARRLGDPTPLYYSLSLFFGDPNGPARLGEHAAVATTSRREAERWKREIEALMAASRRPSPAASA